ncbi:MAG TPA: amidohydrolase family protein [Acidimicrobiia bacterium]|jgi:enamidase|nr:amidohydrolase family protein [Acidimicrobiia bacterium]
MADLAIVNAATVVSGDVNDPIADADSILVRDGLIAEVGRGLDPGDIDKVIDCGGATVMPGLIDSHIHPVLGDFSPRQRVLDFLESYAHGGVTTMISAGEPHTPGRPTDRAGVKALAILAARSFQSVRPGGAKVVAGAVLLEPGLTEDDFAEMADAGVRLVGEIGISGVKDPAEAEPMVRWAQAHGMKVVVHTGGASIPGSGVIGADFVLAVRPDVAGHVNGGPTAPPLSDVARIIDESDAAIEVVHNGNVKACGEVVALAAQRGALDRVLVGTDSPAGTGVVPLGILRTVSWTAAFGGVPPEVAVSFATGNTARVHGLNRGLIASGSEADLIIADAPLGSQAGDALGSLAIGDTPAVYASVIDGVVRFVKSRNTPPPVRTISIPWMATGGGH